MRRKKVQKQKMQHHMRKKNMPAIQTIIEEYRNRNPTGRLYLFLQYPGLRQVFDQIDDDERSGSLYRHAGLDPASIGLSI